jgi:pyruvate dehydrogenase E2 component (dihydrolipoamide acetyltransferase)
METPAMPVSITMPQLGESVTEGTVTRWLKDVGDTVEMDEPLLEVSTDKVDTEIPSPVAGVLVAIKAVEDDVVEVGGELAVVGDAADAIAAPTPAQDAPPQDAPAPAAPAAQQPAQASAPTPPAKAAPAQAAPAQAAPAQAAPAQAAPAPPVPPATPAPAPPAGPGIEVVLPALGESVTEGTVTRWLKNVGDAVEMDEPLLEVSTDKVDTEIPSPIAGTLTEISVAEDETVPVGTVLAIVGAADAVHIGASAATPESAAEVAAPPAQAAQVAPKSVPSPAQIDADAKTSEGSQAQPYASPIVRKLARESGVDLSTVAPTAASGRITKDDVRNASAPAATSTPAPTQPQPPATPATPTQPAAQPAAAPTAPSARPTTSTPTTIERGRTEKMTRLRQVIASRMVESLQVSAQLTTVVEVDVTRIAALRTRAKAGFQEREGISLSFLPFFARATLEALRLFPMVNASVNSDDNTVTYHDQSNLGIAVDTDRGLLVPVIRDAGDLTLAGLARRIADLAQRTRTSQVSPDELSGGTFTLTNTGSRGALFDTPIINQPQVAILGTGAVVKRAAVLTDSNGDDVIAIRSMVFLALTYDHRIVDGSIAAQFLTAIKARLESAEFDAELGV